MIIRASILLTLGLALAACEKERGTGFTGIGPAVSQSIHSGYALDFAGLARVSPRAATGPAVVPGR